ncbi:MAG: hypothetical protein IT193_07940 [Propionibacteriaceae bacterium]|nr:hypothetical protein [Propionibacteriaceae bacterium]
MDKNLVAIAAANDDAEFAASNDAFDAIAKAIIGAAAVERRLGRVHPLPGL